MTIREAWDKAYSLNTTSTRVMTMNFAPLLLKSSDPRLIFIASGVASLEKHYNQRSPMDQSPPKGWPKETLSLFGGYRCSKTGMNMLMREWPRILHSDGVKVWAVAPGLLATGLAGAGPEPLKKKGAAEPSVGALVVLGVIEGERDADVGKAVDRNGVQPW